MAGKVHIPAKEAGTVEGVGSLLEGCIYVRVCTGRKGSKQARDAEEFSTRPKVRASWNRSKVAEVEWMVFTKAHGSSLHKVREK